MTGTQSIRGWRSSRAAASTRRIVGDDAKRSDKGGRSGGRPKADDGIAKLPITEANRPRLARSPVQAERIEESGFCSCSSTGHRIDFDGVWLPGIDE